jgi:uncharacterized protein YndB with AHSA1/START domain
MRDQTSNELTLRIRRILPASRERVYAAVTEPDKLAKWWGPKGFTCPSIDFDPRVGRCYRIAMQPPDGDVFHLTGEFRAVEPPARLALTFVWEPPDPDDQETLAELTLRDARGGTEVTLVQGPFATQARKQLHEDGWTEGFDRLCEVVESATGRPTATRSPH